MSGVMININNSGSMRSTPNFSPATVHAQAFDSSSGRQLIGIHQSPRIHDRQAWERPPLQRDTGELPAVDEQLIVPSKKTKVQQTKPTYESEDDDDDTDTDDDDDDVEDVDGHESLCHSCYGHFRHTSTNIVNKSSQPGLARLASRHPLLQVAWLLLFGGGVAFTIFLIYQQLNRYSKEPISTNIEVEYPNNISFPAVAVCNTNKKSVIELEKLDMTRYIREVSKGPVKYTRDQGWTHLLDTLGRNSSRDVIRQIGRKRRNLILSCFWPDGSNCEQNWTEFYTDFDGICFALNTDLHNTFKASFSGAKQSLKVLLNVELYDMLQEKCVKDDHPGVFVLVYNQTENPLIIHRGITVPLGITANIGIKTKHSDRVYQAHGNCRRKTETNFFNEIGVDGWDACVLDRTYDLVKKNCHCWPFNVPAHVNQTNAKGFPICTYNQHENCAKELLEKPATDATCLDTCESRDFDIFQSWAELPIDELIGSHSQDKPTEGTSTCSSTLISKEELKRVSQTHRNATEIKARHQEDKAAAFEAIISDLTKTYAALEKSNWMPDPAKFRPPDETLSQTLDCYANLATYASQPHSYTHWTLTKVDKLKLLNAGNWTHHTYIEGLNETEFEALYEELKDKRHTDNQIFTYRHGHIKQMRIALQVFAPYGVEKGEQPTSKIDEFFELKKRLNKYTDGNITKEDLANFMHSDLMTEYTKRKFHEKFNAEIEGYLEQSRMRADDFYHQYAALFPNIAANRTLVALAAYELFGVFDNDTMKTTRQLLEQVPMCIVETAAKLNIMLKEFKRLATEYQQDVNRLRDDLEAYLQELKLDANFFAWNFIYLNVYYQNLKVEHNKQRFTYSPWRLLSDIGGTMSLFLGASIVGLVELVWLCMTETTVERRRTLKEAQERRRRRQLRQQRRKRRLNKLEEGERGDPLLPPAQRNMLNNNTGVAF